MGKRSKKANIRREDKKGSKMGFRSYNAISRLDNPNRRIIIENKGTTTDGKTKATELSVESNVRESADITNDGSISTNDGSIQREWVERSITEVDLPKPKAHNMPKTETSESQDTVNDAFMIYPVDIKMKLLPLQTATNTVSIPSKLHLSEVDSLGVKDRNDPRAESVNGPSLPSTSGGSAVEDQNIVNETTTTLLENEIDETHVPIEDSEDRLYRVKRKIRKKYKNRPPNLRQRANIAVRRLQI